MNWRNLMPSDVSAPAFPGELLMEAVVMAASNSLRQYISLPKSALILGAVPKFATRLNPSVDNFFAELLLRSCYEPTDYVPTFEEYIIRGRDEDPEATKSNPGLIGATLIGVGNRLTSTRFHSVYDEHVEAGKRSHSAACQIVHEKHVHPHVGDGPIGYADVLREIGVIDSQGEAGSARHLYPATKLLHKMRVKFPSFASQRLPMLWKRAVIDACLTALVLQHESLAAVTTDTLEKHFKSLWDRDYLPRMRIGIHSHFLDGRPPEYVSLVEEMLFGNANVLRTRNKLLTLDRIGLALHRTWNADVANFLMALLLEGIVQGEPTFVRVRKMCEEVFSQGIHHHAGPLRIIPIEAWDGGPVYHHVVCYRMGSRDIDPHKGIQYWMGDAKVKGVVILRNPVLQTTAIFAKTAKYVHKASLEEEVWESFCNMLQKREPDGRWFHLTKDTGEKAKFILNGTESILTPPTRLLDRDLIGMFAACVRSHCARKSRANRITISRRNV